MKKPLVIIMSLFLVVSTMMVGSLFFVINPKLISLENKVFELEKTKESESIPSPKEFEYQSDRRILAAKKEFSIKFKSQIFGNMSYKITSKYYPRYEYLLKKFDCAYIANEREISSLIVCAYSGQDIGSIGWTVGEIIPNEYLIEMLFINAERSLE